MDNLKRPADIKDLFDISHQTVRRWTDEFESYLSTNATPPSGQMRLFTDDDVRVFATGSKTEVKNRWRINLTKKAQGELQFKSVRHE